MLAACGPAFAVEGFAAVISSTAEAGIDGRRYAVSDTFSLGFRVERVSVRMEDIFCSWSLC